MEEFMALLIPILSVVLGLGTVMLTVFLNYRKKREMFALYHQQRMVALEKGIDVPPIPESFFASPHLARPGRDLLKGLIWLFLGIAISIALYTNHQQKKAMFGLVPLGIGLAYLIYYAVEGRKQASASQNNNKLPPAIGRPVSTLS